MYFDLKQSKPLYSASKALPPRLVTSQGFLLKWQKKKQIKAIAEVYIVSSLLRSTLDPPFSASHGLLPRKSFKTFKNRATTYFCCFVIVLKKLFWTFILELRGFLFCKIFPLWRMTICCFRSSSLFNAFLNFLYRQDNQFYTVFIDLRSWICLLFCEILNVSYYYILLLLFYWYTLSMAAICYFSYCFI